jgi:hypothetical protein
MIEDREEVGLILEGGRSGAIGISGLIVLVAVMDLEVVVEILRLEKIGIRVLLIL